MIDLETLARLLAVPEEAVAPLAHRAAVALERRHRPGVHLTGRAMAEPVDEEVQWRPRVPGGAAYEDLNRVTEEGAEALALAVVCSKRAWKVRRRLQARLAEGADWLMLDSVTGDTVVLEIGGTDEQDLEALLRRKVEQAKASPFALRGSPAACVLRFLEPSVILWSEHEPRAAEP